MRERLRLIPAHGIIDLKQVKKCLTEFFIEYLGILHHTPYPTHFPIL